MYLHSDFLPFSMHRFACSQMDITRFCFKHKIQNVRLIPNSSTFHFMYFSFQIYRFANIKIDPPNPNPNVMYELYICIKFKSKLALQAKKHSCENWVRDVRIADINEFVSKSIHQAKTQNPKIMYEQYQVLKQASTSKQRSTGGNPAAKIGAEMSV